LIKCGAALACVLPWALCLTSRDFPGRWLATLVFFLIAAEKVWSSLFRMPERVAVTPNRDWTAAAVALAYLGIIFGILAEFHARHVGFPSLAAFCVGALVYLAGLALKWAALRCLGKSWSIQLDQARPSALTLVRSGPYRYIRHPIYLGAALDALGVALLFASAWGLASAVVVYWPLLLWRARFEERCLRAELGATYAAYAHDVPGMIPRLARDRRLTALR
jgi:protein-S-isoprenylcysteine O-methyltransferase Ste14